MPLHPDLVELQHRLHRLGVVAVEHADHVCVRLPLLSSVRVRYDGERLACEPRFGALGRTAATVVTVGGGGLGAATFLALAGITPATLAGGFLVGLAGVYEVMRYVLTESTVTRVMTLWETRLPGGAASARVGQGGARELGAPPLVGTAAPAGRGREPVK